MGDGESSHDSVPRPHQTVFGSSVGGSVLQIGQVIVHETRRPKAALRWLTRSGGRTLSGSVLGLGCLMMAGSGTHAAPVVPVAVTADGDGGYVEFQRDGQRFVIYDGRADGDSVVLRFRVDGRDHKPLPNSNGKTGVWNDRTGTTASPKTHQLPALKPNSVVEFQVCLGNSGRRLTVRTETCGEWVTSRNH